MRARAVPASAGVAAPNLQQRLRSAMPCSRSPPPPTSRSASAEPCARTSFNTTDAPARPRSPSAAAPASITAKARSAEGSISRGGTDDGTSGG
eukprot:scaffold3539_cov112-Isochrysis_galbana.AAC.1